MKKLLVILMFFSCSCSSSFIVNGQRIEKKKSLNDTEVKSIGIYIFALVIAWNLPINPMLK